MIHFVTESYFGGNVDVTNRKDMKELTAHQN
jgi:hypothetical protein